MPKVSQITFSHVLALIEKETGISSSELLNEVELKEDSLRNSDNPIDSSKLSDMFIYAMKKSNNFTLSLSIGKSVSYHSLGLLGYLLINADNLTTLIQKFSFYQKLVSGFLKFHFEENDNYFKLAIYINENPHIPVPSFHAEVHLSAIVTILSQIADEKIVPEFVYFSNEYKGDLEKYEEIFGKRVYFQKDENAIFFKKDKLKTKVKNSNPGMLHFFEAQANKVLENQDSSTYYSRVKKEILKNITQKDISIDLIAKNLNISARTLQYKLKDENTTFREALLDVRMNLANHYINSKKIDLNSVALLLGYSEPSSFFRAYKKYFGTTPSKKVN